MDPIPKTPNTHSPRYYGRDDYPIVFGTTPKCGSTSIMHMLKREGFRQVTEIEALAGNMWPHKLLVIRYPFARLVSAYRYFVLEHQRAPHGLVPENVMRRMTLDEFVRFTRDHPDYHWTPQTFQHEHWPEFHLVPLERLNTLWPLLDLGDVLQEKKTSHNLGDVLTGWKRLSTEMQNYVSERYATDFAAYGRATKTTLFN